MRTDEPSVIERVSEKSQSFYWPLRMFPPEQAEAIARLYGFCRVADDWADHCEPDEARAMLEQAKSDLKKGDSDIPEVLDILKLSDGWQVPLEPAIYLLNALLEDVGTRRMESEEDLVRFCYGVAGVVGLLLNPILRVSDPRADRHAVDLGIAMQLSNISRDVVEDADRDRVYLPSDWLGGAISSTEILRPDATLKARISRAVLRTVDLAEIYYQSAGQGYRFIPWRARLPIRMAGTFYRQIGLTVASSPEQIWDRKAKASHRQMLTALIRLLLMNRPPYSGHDATLHLALEGLPGIGTRCSQVEVENEKCMRHGECCDYG